MTRPAFSTIRSNYPSANSVGQSELFKEIGWDEFINNPNYENTCAIRISLALVKSGIEIPGGSHRILKGPYKGRRIEVNQQKLSRILRNPSCLGKPDEELKNSTEANAKLVISTRRGIISFRTWPDYPGGHIDLVFPTSSIGQFGCGSSCFWDATEIWFWELK